MMIMLAAELGPEELVYALDSIVYIVVVSLRLGSMRSVILGSWAAEHTQDRFWGALRFSGRKVRSIRSKATRALFRSIVTAREIVAAFTAAFGDWALL
ncbi:hypothetical protein VE02_09935 [Pseudogymnoascus sp. 03VT05]|nr:hypothetical protein VE02_09935 [Pseudogymnoascus sp. 03VT05]